MTGLSPGPEAPILRGYLQNFVFMITLPLFARRPHKYGHAAHEP